MSRNAKVLLLSGAILVITALFLARIAVSGLGATFISSRQTTSEVTEDTESPVVAKVIDGDTVELADGRRVRYLGINAPELARNGKAAQCFAQTAKEENTRLALDKKIRLEKDTSNRDKYGRLLRYIYLDDGSGREIFLNDYLVRQGFARVLNIPPDLKFEQEFNGAADEAKFQERGLWDACR